MGASATLRIGYIAPASTELVPRLADIARALAPGIQIELHTLTNPDLLDQISNGAIDIGFALASDNAIPGTLATPIAHLHYLLAVSLDDALAATNPAPLSALADRTIVTPATREPTHQHMVDHVRAHADRVAVQDAFTLDAVLSLVGASSASPSCQRNSSPHLPLASHSSTPTPLSPPPHSPSYDLHATPDCCDLSPTVSSLGERRARATRRLVDADGVPVTLPASSSPYCGRWWSSCAPATA